MTVEVRLPARDVLEQAGLAAGVNVEGAELVRDGSNIIYRLRGGIVARIGRSGTEATARLEVDVSAWLKRCLFPAVRLVPTLLQPTMIDGRPVTWWNFLPKHRPATTAELGLTLRNFHQLPMPDELDLAEVDPFSGLEAKISRADILSEDDRLWLTSTLDDLRAEFQHLPVGVPPTVVHGDAWQGNVVVPDVPIGKNPVPIMLDFENVGVGHPEWDLISVAVDRTDFERITADEYAEFVTSYGGYDVTAWEGYRTLASIRELRWACFALSKANTSQRAAREAHHRLACLRGEVPRPWRWEAF
ncbi:phosphotransferase enzyme family protein [Lentzea jiangxiensis]|uniref:phosphotransferase enzyme family protein n=1 Tax=Lentzea jiangxiensis TaxID=641025 RepID=UPI000AB08428|nr:aminoglycoside phosphotransferase family protein [Lentzea jiangxiensis]